MIRTLYGIFGLAMAFIGFMTSSTWYTGIFFFVLYLFTWPIVVAYWLAVAYLLPFLRAQGLI